MARTGSYHSGQFGKLLSDAVARIGFRHVKQAQLQFGDGIGQIGGRTQPEDTAVAGSGELVDGVGELVARDGEEFEVVHVGVEAVAGGEQLVRDLRQVAIVGTKEDHRVRDRCALRFFADKAGQKVRPAASILQCLIGDGAELELAESLA